MNGIIVMLLPVVPCSEPNISYWEEDMPGFDPWDEHIDRPDVCGRVDSSRLHSETVFYVPHHVHLVDRQLLMD